ncbi:efflux RND transporter periplasmic adaptor subunit [Siminovitchia fortis]|uniref:efflux RND transporter periplasmic adaptor subunit n=2 Tax=Siminovitchia fortis TaxID=254758 RepID=UPI0016439100
MTMNKWLRLAVVLGIIIFLTANITLIGREKSKVSRINHITDWSQIRETDIVDSMPVDGVIAEAETYYVMAEKDETIEEFYVNEGDFVEEGTPLFNYQSDDIDRHTAMLDGEIESLQSKKNSIQSLINNLKSMTPPVTPNPRSTDSYKDYDIDSRLLLDIFRDDFNQAEWKQAIEKEIGEKTLEMEKIEADIKKLEQQKDSYLSDKDNLSITSPITGIVKEINPDSPKVITIASDETVFKGELSEEQLSQVNEGMAVNILSNLFKGRLTGEISQIVKLPANGSDHNDKSLYPFTATFEQEDEDVHIGYHVTADIILEEANDVPAVLGKSIRSNGEKSYIWILNEKGIVEKRKVATGLEVGNLYAITEGAEAEEFYATDQREAIKQAPFITPLNLYKLDKAAIKNISRKKAIKYIFIGLLQQ